MPWAQLDAKRAEAAALQSRIAQQGRELSLADEAYNQARIDRQRIDAQAASARGLVEAADDRWVELKAQLARRVRLLYMHPGAALDAYLSQDSSVRPGARKEVRRLGPDRGQRPRRRRPRTPARRSSPGRAASTRSAMPRRARSTSSPRAAREVSGAVADQRALLGQGEGRDRRPHGGAAPGRARGRAAAGRRGRREREPEPRTDHRRCQRWWHAPRRGTDRARRRR